MSLITPEWRARIDAEREERAAYLASLRRKVQLYFWLGKDAEAA